MIEQIKQEIFSKISKERKILNTKTIFNETIKKMKDFNNSFFGEFTMTFKNGDIVHLNQIDRFEKEQMIRINKDAYIKTILNLIQPIKLLSKLDKNVEKEIILLSKGNKKELDKLINYLLNKEMEVTENNKEVYFLEKRKEIEKQTNNTIFYSRYVEDISVKYISYLTKNKNIEEINVTFVSGQDKDVEQNVTIFNEPFGTRLKGRDNYGNDVIEKQYYELLQGLQQNKYILNIKINILFNKVLTDYEKLVFIEDTTNNGIYITEDKERFIDAPIRIMDLYALLTLTDKD